MAEICSVDELEKKSLNEPPPDKTNKMTCMHLPSLFRVFAVFTDQTGYLPSLIRVFAVHMMKEARVISYPLSAQGRLWSDLANARADLSLRWAHRSFCWFCHEATRWSRGSCTIRDHTACVLWHQEELRIYKSKQNPQCMDTPIPDKLYKMCHSTTKAALWLVHPVKTRIIWADAQIRVFSICVKKACVLSYPLSTQRRLWSD